MREAFVLVSTANQQRTKPRTDAPKNAPFSRENPYNRPTTRKPVIWQSVKNNHRISYEARLTGRNLDASKKDCGNILLFDFEIFTGGRVQNNAWIKNLMKHQGTGLIDIVLTDFVVDF